MFQMLQIQLINLLVQLCSEQTHLHLQHTSTAENSNVGETCLHTGEIKDDCL